MFSKLILIVVGLFFLLFSFSAQAQEDEDEPIVLLSDTPIIETGSPGSFNAGFNEPGAMIYHDGQFHMFLTGYGGFPRPNGIAYLVSDDAIEWTNPLDDELILTGEDVPNARAVNAGSVLIEPDGTWVLYFGSYDTGSWFPAGQIWRATASDPIGPWTVSDEPVLTTGEEDGWEARTVFQPEVIQVEDGYIMYYAGAPSSFQMAIGMATSEDGVTWEKHGEPILTAEAGWESRYVNRPRILTHGDDSWIMLYGSNIPGPGVGMAVSEDGINWERVGDEPFLPAELVPGMVVFSEYALAEADGIYYIAVEASDNNTVGPSEIYMLQVGFETLLAHAQS
ncbi:MAG: hypothetical protein RLP44_30850 [Aggregatilineales bacterium]